MSDDLVLYMQTIIVIIGFLCGLEVINIFIKIYKDIF